MSTNDLIAVIALLGAYTAIVFFLSNTLK